MRVPLLVLGVLLIGACSNQPPAKPALTQREKDSIVGASRLPGAAGVRGAQRVADSAAARRVRIDSASQDH